MCSKLIHGWSRSRVIRPQALQLKRHILGGRSAGCRLYRWAGSANVGQASSCKAGQVLMINSLLFGGGRISPVVGRQMG